MMRPLPGGQRHAPQTTHAYTKLQSCKAAKLQSCKAAKLHYIAASHIDSAEWQHIACQSRGNKQKIHAPHRALRGVPLHCTKHSAHAGANPAISPATSAIPAPPIKSPGYSSAICAPLRHAQRMPDTAKKTAHTSSRQAVWWPDVPWPPQPKPPKPPIPWPWINSPAATRGNSARAFAAANAARALPRTCLVMAAMPWQNRGMA